MLQKPRSINNFLSVKSCPKVLLSPINVSFPQFYSHVSDYKHVVWFETTYYLFFFCTHTFIYFNNEFCRKTERDFCSRDDVRSFLRCFINVWDEISFSDDFISFLDGKMIYRDFLSVQKTRPLHKKLLGNFQIKFGV